jgi:hypothetical protein
MAGAPASQGEKNAPLVPCGILLFVFFTPRALRLPGGDRAVSLPGKHSNGASEPCPALRAGGRAGPYVAGDLGNTPQALAPCFAAPAAALRTEMDDPSRGSGIAAHNPLRHASSSPCEPHGLFSPSAQLPACVQRRRGTGHCGSAVQRQDAQRTAGCAAAAVCRRGGAGGACRQLCFAAAKLFTGRVPRVAAG